jgi:uncharacterized protein (TIGR02117 family)
MLRYGALLLAVLSGACAHGPRECEPTHSLYLVSHGWHSGIVLERADLLERQPDLGADLGRSRYLEVGWGEARFYQARETTVGMALRAALRPNASVLQVVAFDEEPRRYFARNEVVEVRTDETGYAAIVGFIADSFTLRPGPQRLGPSLYGEGWFYRAEGSFHLFNTCNSWTAAALEKAACRPRR